MGSLNATGIPVVSKARGTLRNIGGAITTNTGRPVQGVMGVKTNTQQELQGQDRSAASFGTQPDKDIQQYSTMCIAPAKKVATSNDDSLAGGLISRELGKVAPTAVDQPEIANKPVSQRSTMHTGNRTVVRNSDNDSLVARNSNDGFGGS